MAEMKPNKKTKRRISTTMVLLILGCWVVPLLFAVSVSGYIAGKSTWKHISYIVSATVDNTMNNLRRELDGAVYDSFNASYNTSIRDAYGAYRREVAKHNPASSFSLVATVKEFLQNEYNRNDRVRAVYVLFPDVDDGENNPCYVINPNYANYNDVQDFYKSPIAKQAEDLVPTMGTNIIFLRDGGRLYLVRVLSLVENTINPYAALVMELNTARLTDNILSLPWVTDAYIRINGLEINVVDGENEADFEKISAMGNETAVRRIGSDFLRIEGHKQDERIFIDYAIQANVQPLMKDGSTKTIIAFLIVLTVPLIVLVFVFFYRKVTRPMHTLGDFSHRIEEGEFGKQVDTESLGSYEFHELGTNLNSMSARLEYQFERLYREELALRDAKIKALQSQINPHFLGNTLEIINWEARMSGNVKISRMLEALSTMINATLDRTKRPMVHLSEELMYVDSYLYIIKERLGKRLEVVQEIDQNLLDWMVPRLILQPIVENAVEHGVSASKNGVLTIRAYKKDEDYIMLEVENNSPMSPEDEEKVRALIETETEQEGMSSSNIGIRNVHLRLRILYGPNGGLTVKNNKNGHTISSICIGARQLEQ